MTDMMFEELQPKGKCDMPHNSKCYNCSHIPEMEHLQEELRKVISMLGMVERY